MPYADCGDKREYMKKYMRTYRAKRRGDAAWKLVCNADVGILSHDAVSGGTLGETRAELRLALKTINELNATIDELRCEMASLHYELKNAHR